MAADKNPAGPGGKPRSSTPNGKRGPAAPGRPSYFAAKRRFQQHITVNRIARRERLLLLALGAISVLTLLVSGSAWLVTGYVSSSLARLDAGSVAGANTDTMMIVHSPGDRQSIQVVSLPRDSWVSIPGNGMNKINAAYGLGGPPLMVSTVEQATGLAINDYVEVNFAGFVRVINELGGVNVCLPFPVDDSDSGLHLTAGLHHVDGVTALKFVRDRHSFATSDLARIADQQQLLSSLFAQATASGVLADP